MAQSLSFLKGGMFPKFSGFFWSRSSPIRNFDFSIFHDMAKKNVKKNISGFRISHVKEAANGDTSGVRPTRQISMIRKKIGNAHIGFDSNLKAYWETKDDERHSEDES